MGTGVLLDCNFTKSTSWKNAERKIGEHKPVTTGEQACVLMRESACMLGRVMATMIPNAFPLCFTGGLYEARILPAFEKRLSPFLEIEKQKCPTSETVSHGSAC